MQILADSCLALLASLGLWTFCKILFDCLFHKSKMSDNLITIRICDNIPDLDQSFQKSLSVSHDFHLFLVDYDLNQEEAFRAGVPTEKHAGVLFCSCEQFCSKMKEAKEWTIQKSTIK